MLQDRRDTFQPHARVYRWLGQGVQNPTLVTVVLHEYQVPYLNVAIAIRVCATRRSTCNIRTVVIKNLGARPTWAGIRHLPKVIRSITCAMVVADTHNTLSRNANLVRPNSVSLFILGIYRYPQPIRWQPIDFREQFPCVLDGTMLKVVPKAKIAQHLEERMMPRGVTHIL